MSSLASKLAAAPLTTAKSRRGPVAACDIYGPGDLDDYEQVNNRRQLTSWSETQATVDEIRGVRSIHLDKFRYHFSAKCGHWTDEQRDEIRSRGAK